MSNQEEVLLAFGDEGSPSQRAIKHPIALFFHVLFRSLALVLYVFGSYVFSSSFVQLFIAIILLLALDFWVVKNVTGRLLVGLRWWNKVEEDGTSVWQFESKQAPSSNVESVVFWVSLFAFPVLWIVFIFTALLKFAWMWMLIPIVGVALNGANVIGYVKCRKDAGTKIRAMAGQFIGRQLMKQAFSSGSETTSQTMTI
ncbi:PREDICTED: Golgi apparatus membrane protein TVP23 homolog B-like [Amphimedon queenslandica]|uniref:Golgi apparatus membrane protein TVP23 homolog n=1 Tax=Amphimedon queenslandica TaxID=400682 RepID=A0A1X7V8U1_AMPQE|nr:PREDICTED: Golgi apparatus membrane protein TVP23 homolog B-like [Amphimedon queenslandica]|eukprot:XP_019850340.1 PREDICTED: Golgi apparatus membrane protein TVP23 homolog B-like [Amphimedon queenslandica]